MKKIKSPSIIRSVGNKPKIIEEFIGLVNSNTSSVSIAKMTSPMGWEEPGQKPNFNEYTVVLKGTLRVETINEEVHVNRGEAVIINAGEWVKYSSPNNGGAEYIAVCLPAFSPTSVNRDS
tara:strand:- start:260 stop:619 length:360 start_codon:yes stop_codon:yes gene_type:complete